jgi:Flp pilus assembly protein TadG
MSRMIRKLQFLARRFARDRRGAVAVIFIVALVPLIAAGGAAIDISRAYLVQQRLGMAIDAAGLAVGSSNGTEAELRQKMERFFRANYPENEVGVPATPVMTMTDGVIRISATASVEATLMRVVGIHEITVAANTEVTRNLLNLEVSLVLDTTGSMAGQKIADLREAAKALVDIVVWDDQTDYYSKIALAPYSMAVNLDDLADEVRGPIAPPKAITGATRDDPVVITAPGHGFSDGDRVYITGVSGMTQINDRSFRVDNPTTNTFELRNVDGDNYNNYISGGSVYCTQPGCEYHRFINENGDARTFRVSTCVTERTGANAYTDVSPSTAPLGRNYPASGNPCLSNTILPLTSDRTLLKNRIDALQASGSTGGHIGVAWGWYLLSPNFASIWPAASNRPAAYDAPELLKIAVVMTDGEYNSSYCNGVISRDSTSGSGSSSDHINCDAPNGHAFDQATAQCTAMKAAGVIVYTVGFNIVDDQRARDLVNGCATDAAHVYLASGGDALIQAFRDIGRDISQLRLSH